MEELINTTIQKVSEAILDLENPERWDLMSTILKHEGVPILLSFVVVPMLLFFMLAHLFNFQGKTKKTTIILSHALLFFLCEIIGTSLFIILNVVSL